MTKDKKEEIRKAATEVIARMGFHQATIDLIAREAGVAVGTLYNYFKNKDDILSHIFEVEYSKRAAYFDEVIADRELGPLDKIERMLRFHFDQLRANPDVARILLRERDLPVMCRLRGAEGFRGLPRFLVDVLMAGVREGSLRAHDPEIIAPALMGAVEAVMTGYVTDPESRESRLERALDEIHGLLRYGLEKKRAD